MSKVDEILREYAETTVGKNNNEILETIEYLIQKIKGIEESEVAKQLGLRFLEITRGKLLKTINTNSLEVDEDVLRIVKEGDVRLMEKLAAVQLRQQFLRAIEHELKQSTEIEKVQQSTEIEKVQQLLGLKKRVDSIEVRL